jgi:hypothetical protein
VSVSSGINFVNSTLNADTAPNSAFAADPTTVGGGSDLTSPSMPDHGCPQRPVSFRNRFDSEPGWDGGVLEISIAGGGFQDIITAGGSFVQNGYNGSLGAGTNNPLANRPAWNGNSAATSPRSFGFRLRRQVRTSSSDGVSARTTTLSAQDRIPAGMSTRSELTETMLARS